jgi:predicted kinase
MFKVYMLMLTLVALLYTKGVRKPKFILLNGPPGIGKTTIVQKYLKAHSLALGIDGDEIIGMIGQWPDHEPVARRMSYRLMQDLAALHLKSHHDVILPYLILHPAEARRFEEIAEDNGARFYEILLTTDKQDSIRRLLRRGTWGEEGLPTLSRADLPVIEDLYDRMVATAKKRPDTIVIESVDGEIEDTYQQFLEAVDLPAHLYT